MNRELAHNRLPRAGRSGNEHARSALEGATPSNLERIQLKALRFGELRRDRVLTLSTRFGIHFGGRRHTPITSRRSASQVLTQSVTGVFSAIHAPILQLWDHLIYKTVEPCRGDRGDEHETVAQSFRDALCHHVRNL